jgi:hypothetical protein
MPGLPVPTALARGISLSEVRHRSLLAGAFGVDAVPAMRPSDVGHGRDDLSRHAQTAGGLVPGHVLADESKERRQRAWAAGGLGTGQLQDGLDMAAQIAASDGAAWPGPPERTGAGGRDLSWGLGDWKRVCVAVRQSASP